MYKKLDKNKQMDDQIDMCKQRKERGCFYSIVGIAFECPDIDTCPESSK